MQGQHHWGTLDVPGVHVQTTLYHMVSLVHFTFGGRQVNMHMLNFPSILTITTLCPLLRPFRVIVYWSYEHSDYNQSDEQSLAFDSYMIPEDELEAGQK